MKKLLTNIAAVLTILLLNTFGLALHVSAMPMSSHDMGGMNHDSDNSSCATLCRTAVISHEETINPANDEEDDAPTLSFYSVTEILRLDSETIKGKLYAAQILPPPKIPIYLLHGVVRV